MGVSEFFTQNESMIYLIYSFLVFAMSMVCFLKIRKLYRLSMHKGISLFGYAFLTLAMGFLLQFIFYLIQASSYSLTIYSELGLSMLIIYFYANSGFFLVFSQVWKYGQKDETYSLKLKMILLQLVAIAIAIIETIYYESAMSVLNITMLVVLGYGILTVYSKYKKLNRPCSHYLQIFFIAMVLAFVGWFINYLSMFFTSPLIKIYSILVVLLFVLIMLLGIIKVTMKNKASIRI